ncbi:MAG: putative ABC transporter permease, partial [Clostridia bacterium]|nr:putative ABC transporter permease [Clostridia bacterium]
TSWFLEKAFNARWWDYSTYPLNINGRTSVPSSLGFGVAAIVIMKVLIPVADKVISKCPDLMLNILSFIFIAIMSADITLTVCAISDFQFKVAAIDEGFQNHMTDTVNRILSTQGVFYHKAVARISLFVMAGRKGNIAKRLQKRDFKGLMQDFFDLEKEDKKDKGDK